MPYKSKEQRAKRYKEKLLDPVYLAKYKAWQKTARDRKTLFVRLLKSKPCSRCNYRFHPVCMDFHHKDRKAKSFEIGRLSYSKERTLKEIDKCIILCSNCHRLIENQINTEHIIDDYCI